MCVVLVIDILETSTSGRVSAHKMRKGDKICICVSRKPNKQMPVYIYGDDVGHTSTATGKKKKSTQ